MAEGFKISQGYVEIDARDNTEQGLNRVDNAVMSWGKKLGAGITKMMDGWFTKATEQSTKKLQELFDVASDQLDLVSSKKLRIDADILQAEQKIERLSLELKETVDPKQKIIVEAEIAAALAQLKLARKAAEVLARKHVEIKIDVDKLGSKLAADTATGLTAMLKRAASAAAEFAQKFSVSMGQAAASIASSTAASGGMNLVIGLALALASAVGAASTALLTLAPTMWLVGGAAGGLATATVGLIGVFSVLKLGTMGISDALDEFSKNGKISSETLKKLAPNAKNFVKALTGLKKPFDLLQRSVQNRLFAGMADSIRDLASKWLPAATQVLGSFADTINTIGRNVMAAFGQASFIENIKTAAAGFNGVLSQIGATIPGLVQAFGQLAAGSVPFFETIGSLVSGLITKFSTWVAKISETGQLASFMDKASAALRQVWAIGGQVFDLVGNIMEILFPASERYSGNALERIRRTLEDLNDWLGDPENQAKIQGWLKDFQDFADKMGNEVIPKIKEFIGTVKGWFDTVKGWVDSFTSIPERLSAIWDQVVGSARTKLQSMITFFQELPGRIGEALSGLASAVGTRVSEMASNALYNIGYFIGAAVGAMLQLPGKIGNAIISLPSTVQSIFQQASAWAEETMWNMMVSIGGFLSGLPGRISSALSSIPSVIRGIFDSAKSAAMSAMNSMVSGVSSILHSIAGVARSALGGVGSALVGAGRALIQGFIDGISSQISNLRAKLRAITDMLPSWKGPLDTDKKILIPAGQAVMGGFMRGIDSQIPALRDQLSGLTAQLGGMAVSGARAGGGGAVYNFAPGSVVLDASKIKDIQGLIDMVNGVQSTSRQYGVRGAFA